MLRFDLFVAKILAMDYSITHESLIELVKEEVSRIADLAYAENGISLYDAIAIFDRDEDTIKRMIADASSVIAARFRDYLTTSSAQSNTESFNFYLPDIDPTQVAIAKTDLTRFLSLHVVSLWLQERYVSEYEKYSNRATLALDMAERALLTRKRVTR